MKKEISKLEDEARNHGKDSAVLQSLAKEIENLRAGEESVRKVLAESKDELLTEKGKREQLEKELPKRFLGDHAARLHRRSIIPKRENN